MILKGYKALIVFSRYHLENPHHARCGSGRMQREMFDCLQALGMHVFFAGQEDAHIPSEFKKADLLISPSLSFIKLVPYMKHAKKILFPSVSPPLVRDFRMIKAALRFMIKPKDLYPVLPFYKSLKYADKVFIATNKRGIDIFKLHGVKPEQIALHKNSTDVDIFIPPVNGTAVPFTFIHFAGHCGLRKGSYDVLIAWKNWYRNKKNVKLLFIGRMEKGLERFVKSQAIGGVEYYGDFSSQNPKLIELLQSGHVGIFPTLEDQQPSTVIELASCAVPMIITEEAGFNFPCELCWLVPHSNPGALADAMEKAYNDSALGIKSERMREYIKENHNWEKFRPLFKSMIVSLFET